LSFLSSLTILWLAFCLDEIKDSPADGGTSAQTLEKAKEVASQYGIAEQ